jgi:hypothetical protein
MKKPSLTLLMLGLLVLNSFYCRLLDRSVDRSLSLLSSTIQHINLSSAIAEVDFFKMSLITIVFKYCLLNLLLLQCVCILNFNLVQLDIKTKLCAVSALTQELNELTGAPSIHISIQSLEEVVSNIEVVLLSVYNKQLQHQQCWFASWRAPEISHLHRELIRLTALLDSRLNLLAKVVAISTAKSNFHTSNVSYPQLKINSHEKRCRVYPDGNAGGISTSQKHTKAVESLYNSSIKKAASPGTHSPWAAVVQELQAKFRLPHKATSTSVRPCLLPSISPLATKKCSIITNIEQSDATHKVLCKDLPLPERQQPELAVGFISVDSISSNPHADPISSENTVNPVCLLDDRTSKLVPTVHGIFQNFSEDWMMLEK